MLTKDAIEHFGGTKALADAVGVSRHSVWKWGEEPPLDRQCQIEVLSKGALVANRALLNSPAAIRDRKK